MKLADIYLPIMGLNKAQVCFYVLHTFGCQKEGQDLEALHIIIILGTYAVSLYILGCTRGDLDESGRH